jgi:hypothetical protein
MSYISAMGISWPKQYQSCYLTYNNTKALCVSFEFQKMTRSREADDLRLAVFEFYEMELFICICGVPSREGIHIVFVFFYQII